jgi:thiosulfate dehydrogenase [quinone] large subunit
MSSQQRGESLRWAGVAISVLAGAWTLFHLIWNLGNHAADDYWGQALLVLFILALILAFARFLDERTALQAMTPDEQFPEPAITRFFFGSSGSAVLWFVVRMNVGAQWFLAGWNKVKEPAVWGTSEVGLKSFVERALTKSSGANPAVQGWYATFLHQVVMPHVGLFSFLVTYGKIAVGLGILLGILTGIAAGCGVLMNMNYLLAGTVSINPILGMFALFLCFSWRVCGQIGLDRRLLLELGLPWKPGAVFASHLTAPSPAPAHLPS